MMGPVTTPRIIAVFGLLQAILYCTLLPLWEGIDEPFHYGYVQHLVVSRQLPVLDKTPISEEVLRSMRLAPASHVVAAQIPGLTTFREYFALSGAERSRRRESLAGLPVTLGREPAGAGNYEAQQPPLAYLLLVPVEWLQQGSPLIHRVWVLRLVCVLGALALYLFALFKLGNRMQIPAPYLHAAAFFLLCTQNLYAAAAHVANDWLSLPLIVMLVLAADHFWRKPGAAAAALLGAVLSVGLLAKSYFLVFLPFALGLILWRSRRHVLVFSGLVLALAGPWYARNIVLYGSLSGLQSATRSVGLSDVLKTAGGVDWPGAIAGMARGALWSGNSSFTTFSAATLNVVLCLLGAGWVLRAGRTNGEATNSVNRMLLGSALIFSIVPVYAMLVFGSMYGRVSPAANSWYTAGLLPAGILFAFAGCARQPKPGRWLAGGLTLLCVYLAAATYFAKLIPLYAGFEGRVRVGELANLYGSRLAELMDRVGDTALGEARIVFLLAFMEVLLAAILGIRICRALR